MTNKYKWVEAIIDTDFALKMNNLRDNNAIVEYLSVLIGKVYIHEYIYENEILTPKRTKDQIDQLIKKGRMEVVGISSFDGDEYSKIVYEDTVNLLKNADPETIERRKNWGETLSIAFAKAKGVQYFLSDERNLQEFLDVNLNTGMSKDIKTIRIIDFILAMKEVGYKRKETYKLWMACQEKGNLDWAKGMFEKHLWP